MPKMTGYARHYTLLKKLYIPLPPLPEQERIVAKLDTAFAEIDEAIKLTVEKEAALKSLKKSILSSKLMPEDT